MGVSSVPPTKSAGWVAPVCGRAGVPIKDAARKKIEKVTGWLLFISISQSSRVHWGMGATVGSVIPTIDAIIPMRQQPELPRHASWGNLAKGALEPADPRVQDANEPPSGRRDIGACNKKAGVRGSVIHRKPSAGSRSVSRGRRPEWRSNDRGCGGSGTGASDIARGRVELSAIREKPGARHKVHF
jgi:hypothetical protein